MTSIFRENLLKNETVIVTGGGSGIGAVIAKEVGMLGATVAIGARNRSHRRNRHRATSHGHSCLCRSTGYPR